MSPKTMKKCSMIGRNERMWCFMSLKQFVAKRALTGWILKSGPELIANFLQHMRCRSDSIDQAPRSQILSTNLHKNCTKIWLAGQTYHCKARDGSVTNSGREGHRGACLEKISTLNACKSSDLNLFWPHFGRFFFSFLNIPIRENFRCWTVWEKMLLLDRE